MYKDKLKDYCFLTVELFLGYPLKGVLVVVYQHLVILPEPPAFLMLPSSFPLL